MGDLPSAAVASGTGPAFRRKARVLIVDDAVVVRRLVADVLSAEPSIEVVGTAANGRLALAKVPQLAPDVIILDVEMPDMDGIETLTALRKDHPVLPVIMFSTLTERGAAVTLDALLKGANDYVTKPANVGSVTEAMSQVRSELVPRILSLCGIDPVGRQPSDTSPGRPGRLNRVERQRSVTPVRASRPVGVPQRVDAVVIGISTGGPSALAQIVPRFPADLPVPVLVVQHMPPVFTRLLAERLDRSASVVVAEATGGESVQAGHWWIAPGDRHLTVEAHAAGTAQRLVVADGPRENSCRPSVDVLFRGAAEVWGPHLLGVVMTGMGQDGLDGCEAIVDAGGRVIVQDEATSVVWGMPGAVARAGLADAVLGLDDLADEVVRRSVSGRVVTRAGAGAGS